MKVYSCHKLNIWLICLSTLTGISKTMCYFNDRKLDLHSEETPIDEASEY